jgi:hypothetical protein
MSKIWTALLRLKDARKTESLRAAKSAVSRLWFGPAFAAFALVALITLVPASRAFGQARPDDPRPMGVTVLTKDPPVDKSRQRDLKGIVKDEQDNPVEGALVQLKDLKTGKAQTFRTKKDGTYLFYDLNMDIDYELKATYDDLKTAVTKKVSKYDSRKPATVNFQIEHRKPS